MILYAFGESQLKVVTSCYSQVFFTLNYIVKVTIKIYQAVYMGTFYRNMSHVVH